MSTDLDDKPLDAIVVEKILKSMGVNQYEPGVVPQLLEFIHRYTAEILEDAQVYADHASREAIDAEDLKLAVSSRVNFSFAQPPPQDLLTELSMEKNQIPLPFASDKAPGLRLPPLEYQLTTPNYQAPAHLRPSKE
eukprot:Rmarinus@m.29646